VAVLCQVGQGDAVVLRVDGRSAVVIDAGPDPEAVDGCLDRLGVTQVPAVLLSHFHADHVDGLSGVLDGRQVGEIVVSPLDDPAAQARRVRELAADTGVAVRVGEAGEVHRAGPVRWEVVWPQRLISGDGSAPNNASLVLLADVEGVRLLLTGDVEPAAQRALLRSHADLGVDVLKVPHHGSAAQEPGFLLAAGARLALVGVGEDNTYGHPAESTLDLLASTGARVLRTDVDGTVAVVLRRGELGAVTRSG
jgi:competence protein ComEC